MRYEHLLSPLTVAGKTFKHRIVASPAMAGIIAPDGAFPEDQYRIYEQKAAGGCACVCIGETEVNFTYGNKSGFCRGWTMMTPPAGRPGSGGGMRT